MEDFNYNLKPITKDDIDDISMKCWDNREHQLKILDFQETLGIAAFDYNGDCVGLLHFYKVTIPNFNNSLFPDYAKKRLEDWPLGWPLIAAKEKGLHFNGPVLGIACFHVGVYKKSYESDIKYFNKGIGKKLLTSAIEFAEKYNYSAVIGIGGSNDIPEYNIQMGCLPFKVYENLGFTAEAFEVKNNDIPWWVEKWGGKVKEEYEKAKESGIDNKKLCSRLMVLKL
jgi:GNAT superfamily N-acetyltransferase